MSRPSKTRSSLLRQQQQQQQGESPARPAPDPATMLSKEAERAYILGITAPTVSAINAPPPPLLKYDYNAAIIQQQQQQQHRPPGGGGKNSAAVDKFSTPARRRRIVADVARFLLKQYCVKACTNVARFRLETAKAIIIQCCARMARARAMLKLLRFEKRLQCAWKVQMSYRMHRSRKEYKRRYDAWRRRLATTLSIICQRFCRGTLARRLFKKRLEAHKKWLLRRQNIAAQLMQRVARGRIGRNKALYRKKYLENLRLRRAQATLVLQCAIRRYAALLCTRDRRRCRTCGVLIKRETIIWFRNLKAKRLKSAIITQKYVRRLLASLRSKRLRAARNAAMDAERLRQLELAEIERLRLLELAEQERIRNIPPPDPEPTMEVRIIVNLLLLQHMASLGPVVVLEWCLHNFILKYDVADGYSFGKVLFQVVNAVEGVLPSIQQETSIAMHGLPLCTEHEKSIRLAQWDYGNTDEVGSISHVATFPQQWNQQHKVSKRGAKIFVEWKALSVDVHLIFPAGYQHEEAPAQHFHLILEAEDENGAVAITPAQGVVMTDLFSLQSQGCDFGSDDEIERRRKQFFEDVRFKFKNALVFVPLQRPPTPVLDAEEGESEPVEDGGEEEGYRLERSESRPASRAKISVSVSEPPPVDHDRFANIVQRMVRGWYGSRALAASRIMRMLRSHALLKKWRLLVFVVYGRAVQKCIFLQKYIRRHLACNTSDKYRIERCNELASQTYTFLLTSLPSLDISVESGVEDGAPDVDVCHYIKTPSASSKEGWATPLLELLEVKEPPPGCIKVAENLCHIGDSSAVCPNEFNDIITPSDRRYANASASVVIKDSIHDMRHIPIPVLYNNMCKFV